MSGMDRLRRLIGWWRCLTWKAGLYWHLHHDALLAQCFDYKERYLFITEHKPEHERKTRLKLFKPVKGKLPAEVVVAGKEYDRVREAWLKAPSPSPQEREDFEAARVAWWRVIETHQAAIEALHAVECPDCPWCEVQETIFPLPTPEYLRDLKGGSGCLIKTAIAREKNGKRGDRRV